MNKLSKLLLVVVSTVVVLGAMCPPTFANPEVPTTSSAPDTPVPSASTVTSLTPAATQSMTPTSYPSPTVSKSTLSGTVYIGGENGSGAGLVDVTITLTYPEQKNISFSTVSKEGGKFEFIDIPVGRAILEVKQKKDYASELFYSGMVDIKKGKNSKDFTVSLGRSNKILAHVKTTESYPVVKVFAGSYQKGELIGFCVPENQKDTNGYRDCTISFSPEFNKLDYQKTIGTSIQVGLFNDLANNATLISNVVNVFFSDLNGEEKVVNLIQKWSVVKKTVNLKVIVLSTLTGQPLTSGKVDLWSPNSPSSPSKIIGTINLTKANNGTVIFKNLAPGGPYTIYGPYSSKDKRHEAKVYLNNYEYAKTTETIVYLYGDPTKEDLLKNCTKIPQKNVSEFWFCGDLAKNSYQKYKEKYVLLDTEIGSLRSKNPTYSISPIQIIIDSKADTDYGEYIDAAVINKTCQTKKINAQIPTFEEEVILLGPYDPDRWSYRFSDDGPYILYDQNYWKFLIDHEWGHSKDFRRGKCIVWSSTTNPFFDIYSFLKQYDSINVADARNGSRLYDIFSRILWDHENHNYVNHYGIMWEDFATLFQIGNNFGDDYRSEISNLKYKDVYQRLMEIVMENP